MRRSNHRGGWARWILATLALALGSVGIVGPAAGSAGEEFACEEAAAQLEGCCPGYDPHETRCYFAYGCGNDDPVYPEIDRATSDCITRKSCDELRKDGTCASALGNGAIQCR
jgi:hypothetical protein